MNPHMANVNAATFIATGIMLNANFNLTNGNVDINTSLGVIEISTSFFFGTALNA